MNPKIYNWPNLVSLIRVLLAPVLLMLAFTHQPIAFILLLLVSEFTDVLDGFLARYLNQITPLGAKLDSWGDFFTYSTMAFSAWILWPDIAAREWLSMGIIILSFTFPVLIGLIKFGTLTSYHTWSVKLAVAVTVIGYILLFTGLLAWPFQLAAILCLLAAMEEVAITVLLPRPKEDIRTLWQAMDIRRRTP